MNYTGCATCNRVILLEDADEDGNCSDCSEVSIETEDDFLDEDE